MKTEAEGRSKVGKREYLNATLTRKLMKDLFEFFESMIEIPRIRLTGKQSIETLIKEEAFSLGKFLRDGGIWKPRIAKNTLA